MTFKFKKIFTNDNPGQIYDLAESTTKAGKKYVFYDVIQAAREDTEIYPTLEKYGCLDPIMINKQNLYADLTSLKTDLRSLTEQNMRADELWNQLPGKIKAQFDNSRDLFMKDGEAWLKSEIEKEQATQTQETPKSTEGTNE